MRDGSKDKHIFSIIDSKAIIRLSGVRFRVRHQTIKILFRKKSPRSHAQRSVKKIVAILSPEQIVSFYK